MGATTWKKAERIIWEVVNTDEVKVIEVCLVSRLCAWFENTGIEQHNKM